MQTKLVLLGTGTPNACPNANGPSSAVVVGDRAYLVDFGPGVVRQASAAYFNGVDALRPDLLTVAFCTHLHTDHTAGYPDLIFTPWVLERPVPLKVFGPKGLQHMTDHILQAYETDIDFRIHGFEKANESGYRVEVTEIESGIVYRMTWLRWRLFRSATEHWNATAINSPHRTAQSSSPAIPLRWISWQKNRKAVISCCTKWNTPPESPAANQNGRNTTGKCIR